MVPEPGEAKVTCPGFAFASETDNAHSFDRPGVLALANRGAATNGSQFFITEGARFPTLDRRFTISVA